MVAGFWNDLEQARKAEQIVYDSLSSTIGADYTITNVGDNREYYHKGDLLVVDKESGEAICVEVKDDSRIAETHNILCEENVYFYETCELRKGNFYSDYEIYAIVSRSESKIYIYDFSILKSIYKKGELRTIRHTAQETDAYLLPMRVAEKYNALLGVLTY